MPPSPQFHAAIEESTALSDQDVALLHQIVVRAQSDKNVNNRPKNALFQSYEAVFKANNLDTNKDRACLRILLQLGRPGIPGLSLYDKFEYLLRQHGITLEFGDDEASEIVAEGHTSLYQAANPPQAVSADSQTRLRKLERRNSFTSMYDVTSEISRHSKRRSSLSPSSVSRLETNKSAFPKPTQRRRTSTTSSGRPSYSLRPGTAQHGHDLPGGLIEHARVNRKNQGPLGLDQTTSSAPANGLIIEDKTETSAGEESRPTDSPVLLPEPPYLPTETHLIRDAQRFDDFRIQLLVKQVFDGWLSRARGHLGKSRILEQEARDKDNLTLQRQAFDLWRVAYQRLRQEEEVNHFFEHLYNRAGDTYDRYLKLKAFSHWYETSLHATARTNAARQKYLHIKYFNAWVKLTVTNELKAERHGLKSPLQLLRKRAAKYYSDQIDSLALYHNNLTKYVFWRWFWEWCDRGVPKYRDNVLKKSAVLAWSRKLNAQRNLDLQAEENSKQTVLQCKFQLWARKTRIDVAGDRQAEAFRRRQLINGCVKKWREEAHLSPLAKRVVRMSDWRIARTNFNVWLHRVRMVVSANAVDLLRTKQNAFTAWNERLRHENLKAILDERILAQNLYKWVLSQRFALMSRLHDHSVKHAAFRRFVEGFNRHKVRLLKQDSQVSISRNSKVLTSTIQSWRRRLNLNRGQARVAMDNFVPKIEHDTFSVWLAGLRCIQRKEQWSKDAAFYFTMTKLLKRWHTVAIESKKKRQQESYKKMRKELKIKLAHRVLDKWRWRVKGVISMHGKAEDKCANTTRELTQHILGAWHELTSSKRRIASDASTIYEHRLASNALRAWGDALKQITTIQTRADQFYRFRLSDVCSMQLRRTSMRAFEVKRRQQDADAMQERHGGKHIRNIFRHWAAKSKEFTRQALVADPSLSGEPELTDAGYGTASNDDPPFAAGVTFGATQRAEEWTAFDGDLLEGGDWIPPTEEPPQGTSTPMPTPGYLNTPSKRAARARALASISTTPLVTPFAARLRAGMAKSAIQERVSTAKRGGFALGSRVAFPEISSGDKQDEGRGS